MDSPVPSEGRVGLVILKGTPPRLRQEKLVEALPAVAPPVRAVRRRRRPLPPSRPGAALALEGLGLKGTASPAFGLGAAGLNAGEGRPDVPVAVLRQGLEEQGPEREVGRHDVRAGGPLAPAYVPDGMRAVPVAAAGVCALVSACTVEQEVQLVGRL